MKKYLIIMCLVLPVFLCIPALADDNTDSFELAPKPDVSTSDINIPPEENKDADQAQIARETELATGIADAIARENYRRALGLISNALQEFDTPAKRAEIYCTRGFVYHKMGNIDGALADFHRAMELAPDAPLPYEARAAVYMELDNAALAMIDLDRAIELGSDDPRTYIQRGDLNVARNNLPGALRMYSAAIERDPENTEALFQRGFVYSQLGLTAHAEADLNIVAAEMPDQSFVYNQRAIVYAQMGLFDKSLKDFQTALELDPNDTAALSNLGYTHFELGDLDAAFDAYDRAGDIDKNDPYSLCNRAEAYFHIGEKVKAKSTLKKCLKAAADNPEFIKYEAAYIAALKYMKKLLEKGGIPEYGALMEKGRAALEESDRLSAFFNFSLAYMLDPSDPDALFMLGKTSALLARNFYAQQFLNRYLVLQPGGPHAKEAADILETLKPDIDD
jgi:tetratricopeptide (TPR) repeat protein